MDSSRVRLQEPEAHQALSLQNSLGSAEAYGFKRKTPQTLAYRSRVKRLYIYYIESKDFELKIK